MTVEIQLNKGQVTIVSDEDIDLAQTQTKWSASFHPAYADGGKFRVQRHTPAVNGKRKTEFIHRVIVSRMLGRPLVRGEQVDHINSNPLDNRRENLRLASSLQNNKNRPKPNTNKSGYKGVHWHSGAQKWRASITIDGKDLSLGLYDDPAAAYDAYCALAKAHHGEFVNLK